MTRRNGNSRGRKPGTLVIIGGHEDKSGEQVILRALTDQCDGGALVVVTVASDLPDEQWTDYEKVFRGHGVRRVRHFHVDTREEALADGRLKPFDDAAVVFLTGGDQLKLTSQLGDTPVFTRIREIYEHGGCFGGISAGASVVCETMLVSGSSGSSPHIDDSLRMAPGFGLIPGIIVDQHFAERGRMGRLIGAVAQNPRIIGVGIDENTAIVCHGHDSFTVIGDGGVYVVDARDVTRSNLLEGERDQTLSVFDMRLHLLNVGDEFDLGERRPRSAPAETALARVGSGGEDGEGEKAGKRR